MRNIIKRWISGIVPAVMLLSLIPCAQAAETINGWSVNYSNIQEGQEAAVVLDTAEKFSGESSLKVKFNIAKSNNKYVTVKQPVLLEKGHSYRYGMAIKGRKASGVSATFDLGDRTSLTPWGQNFDWTQYEVAYYHKGETQTKQFEILIEDSTDALWMDDMYLYDVSDPQKKNLLVNPGFEKDSSGAGVNISTGDVEALYYKIKQADSFQADEIAKVMGAFGYAPVFPAKEIVIDGSMDDWDAYAELTMPTLPTQYYFFEDVKPDVKIKYKYAYDDANFYIAAQVEDDVYCAFDNAADYWKGDSLQLALSEYGEMYGSEISFVHNENGGSIYSNNHTEQELSTIQLKTSQKGNKTVYEAAIPWKLKWNERPHNLLFSFLANDNDGNGRAYTVEVAPRGISVAPKSNANFPELELVEEQKDWYSWFEGPRNMDVTAATELSLFLVNNGEEKNFEVTIPELQTKDTIRLPEAAGVRKVYKYTPDTHGEKVITAQITDGVNHWECQFNLYVSPVEATFQKQVQELERSTKEIKTLLEKCKEQGIRTDYETMQYSVLERFTQYLKEDISKEIYKRADYYIETLTDIYMRAKECLLAYLSGSEKPKEVPRYVTGDVEIDGKVLYADTELNGDISKRPVFFTGYGHFEQAREDIPYFKDFGANIIQMEAGPGFVLKPTSGVKDWLDGGNSGGVETKFTRDTAQKAAGEASLKIENKTSKRDNAYHSIQQYVEVEPNTTYEFGFMAKGENQNGSWVSADGFDFEKRNQIDSGTFDWREYKLQMTTGSGQTSAQFVILTEDKTDALYIDNVYMKKAGSNENLLKNPGFEETESADEKFDYYTQEVKGQIKALQDAQENDISICLLLSPHYFTQFLYDTYPDLKAAGGGNLPFVITHPAAKEMLEFYIRSFLQEIKPYQSVSSICLANEPWFFSYNEPYYEPLWTAYIKELYHNDIKELSEVYGKAYQSFEEVKMPDSVESTPRFYDYKNFNDSVMMEFLSFMADIVKQELPDMPIHAKTMNYLGHNDNPDVRWLLLTGGNHEKIAAISDLNGNDAGNELRDMSAADMDERALRKSMFYDYQTSIKTAPVINSEDHMILDGNSDYVPQHAKLIQADLWQGAVHGRGMSVLWVWDRREELDYINGNILYRPDCVETVGKAGLDLNRLSEEIYSIINENADVGILYSAASRIYAPENMSAAYQLYTSTLFNGLKPIFVLEGAEERMNDYPVLLVPNSPNVLSSTFEAVKNYVQNGGKLLVIGENSFRYDEHNQPYPEDEVQKIMSHATVLSSDANGYRLISPQNNEISEAVRRILDETGLVKVELVDAANGERIQNVEWLSSVHNGKMVINICNYTWDMPKTVAVKVGGRSIGQLMELRSGDSIDGQITLEPYQPIVVSFEVENPFMDTLGHWAEQSIVSLAEKNVVKGISASRFAPEKTLTRAEFTALVTRALSLPEKNYAGGLKDVKAQDWYADAIQAAWNEQIISPLIQDGNIHPLTPITREEMAAVLVQAVELKKGTVPAQDIVFSDFDLAQKQYQEAIQKAAGLGLMQGYEGLFRPSDHATRAESVKVIESLLDVLQ